MKIYLNILFLTFLSFFMISCSTMNDWEVSKIIDKTERWLFATEDNSDEEEVSFDEYNDKELNEEQSAVVRDNDNILLVACPGSGKTRTLTYKVANELSKLDSHKKFVIAITYTNRAANEIKERIEQ